MPVTFNTPTSHRVIMLDKDAAFMLKAMKTSGNIPGAMFAEALPDALKDLEARVQLEVNEEEASEKNSTDENYVGVNTKAMPLIELLMKAIEQKETLMWESS